jgi:hypothetical protein
MRELRALSDRWPAAQSVPGAPRIFSQVGSVARELLESCPERKRLDCKTRVLRVVIDLAGPPSLHVVGRRAARALFKAGDPILEIVRLPVRGAPCASSKLVGFR